MRRRAPGRPGRASRANRALLGAGVLLLAGMAGLQALPRAGGAGARAGGGRVSAVPATTVHSRGGPPELAVGEAPVEGQRGSSSTLEEAEEEQQGERQLEPGAREAGISSTAAEGAEEVVARPTSLPAELGLGIAGPKGAGATGAAGAVGNLSLHTMVSPKYRPFWENLRDSAEAHAGPGVSLTATMVEDVKLKKGGGNKMRGNHKKIDLIVSLLREAIATARVGQGSDGPAAVKVLEPAPPPAFVCWLDATALFWGPLDWRPGPKADLWFSREGSHGNTQQQVNLGFLCAAANPKALAFFEAVSARIEKHGAWDQAVVNDFLAAGVPPVSWAPVPQSAVEMLSDRWDDCDEGRQAGLLKFISLKTPKGALYSQYLHFSRNGRQGKCPPSLKGRHRLWEAREEKKRRKAEARTRRKQKKGGGQKASQGGGAHLRGGEQGRRLRRAHSSPLQSP